jgi:hypothetical protein
MSWSGTYEPPTHEEMQEVIKLVDDLFVSSRKVPKRTPGKRKHKCKSAARMKVKR